MKFYHHQTLSKLTLALLDTFNDVAVERYDEQGLRLGDYTVPIVFGGRDKAYVLSEQDSEAMLRGNVNILPRMALTFESLVPARNRQTNKYIKINKDIGTEKIAFQYNAVPMDFTFMINIATRTMSDMSMIVEQILPYFNPTYSLFINELEIQDVPTSIPVSMDDVSIVLPEEYEPDEIRIIEGTISLTVKGNLYPPIKEAGKVEKVKIYMGHNINNQELRSTRYQFDVDENGLKTNFEHDVFADTMGQNAPIVSSIAGDLNCVDGETRTYTVLFSDLDSDNFIYVWSIVSGTGTISTGAETVIYTSAGNLTSNETITAQVIVIDEKGLQSTPYQFNINVTAV